MHPLLAEIDQPRIFDGDKEYIGELRHRCQTDFFFLAPLLGYYDFRPDLHGPVAELYVQKKPGLAIEQQDEEIKNRLHLDPRHTFKTTAGMVDVSQWIITCPEITICNETATKELARDLTLRQARNFVCPEGKAPSIFQRLWPEFVVKRLKGPYRAPCSKVDTVEPTIYSTSIGSSQSGRHPWILNPDDTADTKNSGIDATDESRDQVWNSYNTNLNVLRHGGYVHIRGTRYHPNDMYGRTLESVDPSLWKMLIRGSLRVKSGRRLVEGEFPAEEDIELLWPGLLSYPFLKEKFKEYRSFMCQQMNDPQGGGVALFPEERYGQMRVDETLVPMIGTRRMCWRPACETKWGRYSVGVVVLDFQARMYVIDAWRGVYTPTEEAERIVEGLRKHQTGELVVEQTPGSEDLVTQIENAAMLRNWTVRTERPEFQSDDLKRKGRCMGLEPRAKAGRLWISEGVGNQREEIKKQFTQFGLTEELGFLDVISRLAARIPASLLTQQATQAQKDARQRASGQAAWDVLFAQGGIQAVDNAIVEDTRTTQARQNSYGLRPMLGGLDG